MSETSDHQKLLKTQRREVFFFLSEAPNIRRYPLQKSTGNPSCRTVSNLQNYIPLEYEIIHSVFLETAQLSGQDNLMDHHAPKAGHRICIISQCDTSQFSRWVHQVL